DAQKAEDEDDDDLGGLEMPEPAEVHDHDEADEGLEDEDELALGDQVRLASLVDQLAHLEHRAVDGKRLELPVDDEPEDSAQGAHDEPELEEQPSAHPQELHAIEIGKDQARLVGMRGGGDEQGGAGGGKSREGARKRRLERVHET